MADAHEELEQLLDEHGLCSFRFYAQHAHVSTESAKEVLKSYAEAHAGSVHVVYLLGGKVSSGDSGRYVCICAQSHGMDPRHTPAPYLSRAAPSSINLCRKRSLKRPRGPSIL